MEIIRVVDVKVEKSCQTFVIAERNITMLFFHSFEIFFLNITPRSSKVVGRISTKRFCLMARKFRKLCIWKYFTLCGEKLITSSNNRMEMSLWENFSYSTLCHLVTRVPWFTFLSCHTQLLRATVFGTCSGDSTLWKMIFTSFAFYNVNFCIFTANSNQLAWFAFNCNVILDIYRSWLPFGSEII